MQYTWLQLIVGGLLFGWAVQSAMWLVQWRRRDAGVVDVGWTAGVGVLGVLYALQAAGWGPRQWLAAVMIGLWALRLAAYIVTDRILDAEEDGRYQALRAHWGGKANRNFYFFFTSQALVIVLFALTVLPGACRVAPGWGWREALAVLIWLVAVGGESLADRQLARWRRDPAHRGMTCRHGLWRYSRHPNYFCEWLHWWAYVALGWSAPYAVLAWLGPVVMLLFLYRLTGIPYTEKRAVASRGDDYRQYQRTTSAFFPCPPRDAITHQCIDLIERGLGPDFLVRLGMRRLLAARLREERRGGLVAQRRRQQEFIDSMATAPIAIATAAANEQHYELPASFFEQVLGPHLKYSCCQWPAGVETLEQAEDAMLALTARRADLADGQRILELGCGWGSLTLWMARQYPAARITAVSNSSSQGAFIRARAERLGLDNVTVLTADMNEFDAPGTFDRVVSVEMFEHMRNWSSLLARIRRWLTPEGRLFIHIFVHRTLAYPFEVEGAANWMGRHFFTGGMMPSADLFLRHQADFLLCDEWHVDGRDYERTLLAWLELQDRNRATLMPVFRQTYGEKDAARWFQRWRLFFLACAELFGYNHGREWFVAHYLLRPRDA